MKRWLLLIFVLFIVLVPAQAQAQSDERILSFDSEIIIDNTNTAKIKEKIVYDFAQNQRRGIFRTIPTITLDSNSDRYYQYKVDWISATHNGKEVDTKIENTDNTSALRIGNPDIYFSGTNTYEIVYTLSPIVLKDGDLDYINLNITGNEWNVPINFVTATITTESGAKFLQTRCYTGFAGSTEQNCKHKNNQLYAAFEARNLQAQQGLTANIQTENNGFDPALYAETVEEPPINYWPYSPIAIGILAVFFGIGLKIHKTIAHIKRKKSKTIIPQYEAPKDLSVGEMGLLHDNTTNMNEITAMIINLAVNGHIKITQTRKKSLFKSAQYTFDRLQTTNKLDPQEQILIDVLFPDGQNTINLKDIDKESAAVKIAIVKHGLQTSLEDKGVRLKSNQLASQKVINKIFLGFVGAIIIFSLIYTVYRITSGLVVDFDIGRAMFGIFLIGVGYFSSTSIHISNYGYDKWAEIEGLILYMTVAEKDRMKFHDAPEKNPELFSALLPSAIALGVDKQWANQFKDLDISQNLNWYQGQSGNFNSVLLANSLSGDLNSVLNSSFTAPSQSSSSFSGGGFSGGGGGGGGGGSW